MRETGNNDEVRAGAHRQGKAGDGQGSRRQAITAVPGRMASVRYQVRRPCHPGRVGKAIFRRPTDPRKGEQVKLCEDYPCCGHTPEDPCAPQWYDEPGAFDTSRRGNEHAFCDHENGECDVDYDEDDLLPQDW
jgi:hypothetical protein